MKTKQNKSWAILL